MYISKTDYTHKTIYIGPHINARETKWLPMKREVGKKEERIEKTFILLYL